jgi:transcription elongation GreA/GreB family factor
MSVAFRRDSDEEHLEPKFARPIPPGPNLVTPRGKALIDGAVIASANAISAAVGEAAIALAKRDLSYWQSRQNSAELVAEPDGTRVAMGTIVHFTLNGFSRTLAIVGVDEADTADDLIGFTAPLARAMMGAEVGDALAFAGNDDAIEILSITAAPLPVRSSP